MTTLFTLTSCIWPCHLYGCCDFSAGRLMGKMRRCRGMCREFCTSSPGGYDEQTEGRSIHSLIAAQHIVSGLKYWTSELFPHLLFFCFDKMQSFVIISQGVERVSLSVIVTTDGSVEHYSQHYRCAASYWPSELPLPEVYTVEQKCAFRTSAGDPGGWCTPYDSHHSQALSRAGGTSYWELHSTSAVW